MGQHSAPRPARTAAEARYRLIRSIKPRLTSTQGMITVIFVILGFATTAAISGSSADLLLANARQSDLVSVLDDLAQREARLQTELNRLETSREKILGGSEYDALTEAQRRTAALAILAGSEPISGQGITVSISGSLTAGTMIDAIQELRDAGATAMAISDRDLAVRVVANTWFADSEDGITVSGTALKVPITISVIGDSAILQPALEIPGGLQDTIGAGGGSVSISATPNVIIDAVVPLPNS